MKILKNKNYLNELWKKITAAKNHFLEFVGVLLAVILISIQNSILLIKQPRRRMPVSTNYIGEKNERPCEYQKMLKDEKYLIGSKKSLLLDDYVLENMQ